MLVIDFSKYNPQPGSEDRNNLRIAAHKYLEEEVDNNHDGHIQVEELQKNCHLTREGAMFLIHQYGHKLDISNKETNLAEALRKMDRNFWSDWVSLGGIGKKAIQKVNRQGHNFFLKEPDLTNSPLNDDKAWYIKPASNNSKNMLIPENTTINETEDSESTDTQEEVKISTTFADKVEEYLALDAAERAKKPISYLFDSEKSKAENLELLTAYLAHRQEITSGSVTEEDESYTVKNKDLEVPKNELEAFLGITNAKNLTKEEFTVLVTDLDKLGSKIGDSLEQDGNIAHTILDAYTKGVMGGYFTSDATTHEATDTEDEATKVAETFLKDEFKLEENDSVDDATLQKILFRGLEVYGENSLSEEEQNKILEAFKSTYGTTGTTMNRGQVVKGLVELDAKNKIDKTYDYILTANSLVELSEEHDKKLEEQKKKKEEQKESANPDDSTTSNPGTATPGTNPGDPLNVYTKPEEETKEEDAKSKSSPTTAQPVKVVKTPPNKKSSQMSTLAQIALAFGLAGLITTLTDKNTVIQTRYTPTPIPYRHPYMARAVQQNLQANFYNNFYGSPYLYGMPAFNSEPTMINSYQA